MIPEIALDWYRKGFGAVLATVVQTWGSAPRKAGAQLVVSGSGKIEGSVSGGCVEGAVILEAMEIINSKKTKLLEYGVADDDAFAVGLACGGEIRILLEPIGSALPVKMLEELVHARKCRIPVAYSVNYKNQARNISYDGFAAQFKLDKSELLPDGQTFLAIHNPPIRIIIVGAVHIAQALVKIFRILGFYCIIVDPRASFATEDRFPLEKVITEWPDEVLADLGSDPRTAMVVLTHDPKIDDPALEYALSSDYFYIGALGSKNTHKLRIERLTEKGFAKKALDRIHSPIGINFHSFSPEEIAVSISAEVMVVLRGKK